MARQRVSARAIAAQYVQEWFDSLMAMDGHGSRAIQLDPDLFDGSAFEAVADAVRRDNEHDGVTPSDADDVPGFQRRWAMEAGYLIGVQVGLRLRNGGGQ